MESYIPWCSITLYPISVTIEVTAWFNTDCIYPPPPLLSTSLKNSTDLDKLEMCSLEVRVEQLLHLLYTGYATDRRHPHEFHSRVRPVVDQKSHNIKVAQFDRLVQRRVSICFLRSGLHRSTTIITRSRSRQRRWLRSIPASWNNHRSEVYSKNRY